MLVAEDLRGYQALKKSMQYVKGCWWKVLGCFVFLGLWLCITAWFLAFLGSFLGYWGEIAVSFVFTLLATPFAVIYMFELYSRLKLRESTEDH